MKFLVSGATGLIGAELCQQLHAAGHHVTILSRSVEKGRQLGFETFAWQPEKEPPSAQAFAGVDVIVHLAGENVAGGRWTQDRKRRIRASRLLSTRHLIAGIQAANTKPQTLICASAIGFYGDRGDEMLTETSQAGTGFLPDVCVQWEKEATAARASGLRVVQVRIGVVLAKRGGAMQPMLPIFKLGLGGTVGSGQQWFSWIHVQDVIGVLQHAIFTESVSGPINAVAPNCVTNAEFTQVLAAALHRPAWFVVPGFILRLGLGEMADLMLGGCRVIPQVAVETGYKFQFPDLRVALADLFSAHNPASQV